VNRASLSPCATWRTRSSALDAPGPALCPGRVLLAVFSLASPLICVGDPRKGGSVGCFIVVRSHFRSVLRAVDRKSGSRWSARSAARTNDLEADEDPPHTGSARSEAKTARFKSCDASASAEGLREQIVACRRPALSGSTDDGPAT